MHFMKTENTITVFIKGVPETLDKTNRNFDKVVECLKSKCPDEEIIELINLGKYIETKSDGLITVQGGEVFYDGTVVNNYLTESILKMLNDGFDIDPFIKFMSNLMENPSFRAVEELYGFLENSKLPITEDGHFLAYKMVSKDFKDIHTGTFDNSVGSVCSMSRNKVNDNKNETCSTGLHFAAYSYASTFGSGNLVLLKINPRDVVSIPVDYNNAKGRCCRYEVIQVIEDDSVEDNFDSRKDYHSLSTEDRLIELFENEDRLIELFENVGYEPLFDYLDKVGCEEDDISFIEDAIHSGPDEVLDFLEAMEYEGDLKIEGIVAFYLDTQEAKERSSC